jgi:hypothetical protein
MFARAEPPQLYLSPVDRMLHLIGAQGGVWYVGGDTLMRTTDLNGDGLFDAWTRESVSPTVDKNGLRRATPGEAIEAVFDAGGYLLYSGQGSVAISAAEHAQTLFTTSPPTDRESWEAFRDRLRPYKAERRDPADLRAWLDPFAGPRSDIDGASLANLRFIGDGFRFELSLEPGYRTTGPDLLGLTGLAPGEDLIENHGGVFTVTPLVPPQLSLDVRYFAEGGAAGAAQVTIQNTGSADASGLMLVAESVAGDGAVIELTRQPVDALAGQAARVRVDIPSALAAGAALRAQLEDSEGQLLAAGELALPAGPATQRAPAIFGLLQAPILASVLGLFAGLIALAALLAAIRRGEQLPS